MHASLLIVIIFFLSFGYATMNEYTSHYDIHVYFTKDTPSEVEAEALRQRIQQVFPKMRVFSPQRNPVGPHPIGMWEGHIYDEPSFA